MIVRYRCPSCGDVVQFTDSPIQVDGDTISIETVLTHHGSQDAACAWFTVNLTITENITAMTQPKSVKSACSIDCDCLCHDVHGGPVHYREHCSDRCSCQKHVAQRITEAGEHS